MRGIMLATLTVSLVIAPALTMGVPADAQSTATLDQLCGEDFDAAYVAYILQLHCDIATFISENGGGISNWCVRKLVNQIGPEQTDLARRLSGFDITASSTTERVSTAAAGLADCKCSFYDTRFVRALICMLDQQRTAAALAQQRACSPVIREQARVAARSADRQIEAFTRWLRGDSMYTKNENPCRPVYCPCCWD